MNATKKKYTNFLKSLGPGLLWAGAAIGVSHLVQSTRAGANYGFALVWAVILANVFKYPFFEYGPRYAAATGENLLQGYKRLGTWVLVLFLVLTFGTMFTIQAAVTIVTAALLSYGTGGGFSPLQWSMIILAICMFLLAVGKYSLLDKTIKVVIVVLTISTFFALFAAVGSRGLQTAPTAVVPDIWGTTGIFFLIALMGWMPSAIDISVWSSLWTLEKTKQTGYKPKLKESLLDFNIGYIGTAVISLSFLTLGALVIFGSGETLSDKAGVFAGQFIGLYTRGIGEWSRYIITIAAITTMFSTTLTCLDAFPRVLKTATEILFPAVKKETQTKTEDKNSQWVYWSWMLIVAGGAVIILILFSGSKTFTFIVDLATTLSFLTAPFLAIINYKVVTGKHMPAEGIPPKWLKLLSWAGFVFHARGWGVRLPLASCANIFFFFFCHCG
ncbi:MAG: divalent metal cation transporter, partial [bacterium]|nr:divalent metal cation transporter [bacterium]